MKWIKTGKYTFIKNERQLVGNKILCKYYSKQILNQLMSLRKAALSIMSNLFLSLGVLPTFAKRSEKYPSPIIRLLPSLPKPSKPLLLSPLRILPF